MQAEGLIKELYMKVYNCIGALSRKIGKMYCFQKKYFDKKIERCDIELP